MLKPNNDIRTELVRCGVCQFDIAHALGVSPATISYKLRVQLSPEEREQFLSIIREIAESRGTKIEA